VMLMSAWPITPVTAPSSARAATQGVHRRESDRS
jgi:hypothetical protein